MDVLFIGGTGQISEPCVAQAISQGHRVFVLNRGSTRQTLPPGVDSITGDMDADDPYLNLGDRRFDVVCQFRAFTPAQVQKDIDAFSGRAGQYVFISSASVYEKPVRVPVITEETPAINPYWPYSQQKIACEELIRDSGLDWTIVRPSHTVRTGLPAQIEGGDRMVQRMRAGKPVITAGDGTSLWTLTRSADFAPPFVGLFGKDKAMREIFHITQHMHAYNWDQIHHAIARGFGLEADLVHVPTDTLVKYNKDWIGPLLGDKSWTAVFDNSKVMSVAGEFSTETDLDKVLAEPVASIAASLPATPPAPDAVDDLLDRIAMEQRALGQ